MELEDKYSLRELIEDADAKIYVATEILTGKRVCIFLFPAEQALAQKDLLLQLRSVDRLRFPELIEVGEDRGTPFVVTQPTGGLAELRARLAGLQAAPAPASVGTGKISAEPHTGQPPAETSGQSTAGSFTQMFQAAYPPINEPAPEIPEFLSSQQQPEPGAFTQMFESASPPVAEPSLQAPKDISPASSASPPAQAAPGEFTRFFSAASTTKPAPEPQNLQSQEPFSNIFKGGADSGAPPASATGIFHSKRSESPPYPTTRAPGSQAGEFTQMFGKISTKEEPAPAPMERIPEQHAPAKDSPGEYTRIFGAEQLLQEPGAASATAPAGEPETTAPPKSPSLLIPILIGILLLLLAVLSIVVFASLE